MVAYTLARLILSSFQNILSRRLTEFILSAGTFDTNTLSLGPSRFHALLELVDLDELEMFFAFYFNFLLK